MLVPSKSDFWRGRKLDLLVFRRDIPYPNASCATNGVWFAYHLCLVNLSIFAYDLNLMRMSIDSKLRTRQFSRCFHVCLCPSYLWKSQISMSSSRSNVSELLTGWCLSDSSLWFPSWYVWSYRQQTVWTVIWIGQPSKYPPCQVSSYRSDRGHLRWLYLN